MLVPGVMVHIVVETVSNLITVSCLNAIPFGCEWGFGAPSGDLLWMNHPSSPSLNVRTRHSPTWISSDSGNPRHVGVRQFEASTLHSMYLHGSQSRWSQVSTVQCGQWMWLGNATSRKLGLDSAKGIELLKRIKVDNYRSRFSQSQFISKAGGVKQFEFVSSSGQSCDACDAWCLSYPTFLHIESTKSQESKGWSKRSFYIIFPQLIFNLFPWGEYCHFPHPMTKKDRGLSGTRPMHPDAKDPTCRFYCPMM